MRSKKSDTCTVLVSGASGIVGYGILRSLKDAGCTLIGTTIYEESPANCFADVVELAPLTSSPDYIPWLTATIEKHHVDMIIPAIEADMSAWNKHRAELESTGTFVLLNRPELVELCLDKWAFYQKLTEAGFRHCIASSLEPDFEQFPLPFLLKPRCGFGARGIVKVEDWETFERYREDIGQTLMMQEFVGTEREEYTVSAFFDRDSRMRASIALRRKLSKQGFTELAEVVFPDDLIAVIQELAGILRPVGPTNFQFRNHRGQWKLLEVNPRISSATSIRTAFGYNESKMAVDYFLRGREVSQPQVRKGHAIRYTEDYIFYDSDHI